MHRWVEAGRIHSNVIVRSSPYAGRDGGEELYLIAGLRPSLEAKNRITEE
mgnify:CR=1 FL=1